MASFSVSAVSGHSVGSIGYCPSAHVTSSLLPCGPVYCVTTVFSAAATFRHSALPPPTERTESPSSSTHSTAGVPGEHAWITLFSQPTCFPQLFGLPNAMKFKLYFSTHLPCDSWNVVVTEVVAVVVVVGEVVAVVVVVGVVDADDVWEVVAVVVAVVDTVVVAVEVPVVVGVVTLQF